MRHSPERVADVACGVFGIVRHQLYGRNGRGQRERDHEALRRRSLVIKAIRNISGASFPDIAAAVCKASHSSVYSSWESSASTPDEQVLFDSSVRNLLRAYEPKPPPQKPVDRDTRCDGVWIGRGEQVDWERRATT